MNKLFTLFLALALLASVGIVGCGGAVDNTTQAVENKERPPANTPDEDAQGKNPDATIANGTGETKTPPK